MRIEFSLKTRLSHRFERWISVDEEERRWNNVCPRSQIQRREKDSESLVQGQAVLDATLRPTSIFSLDARVIGLPAAFSPERRLRLDPDGFGLPTLFDDILGYDVDLFVHLRDQFCRSFPQFRSVRLETESGVDRVERGQRHPDGSAATGKGIRFEMACGRRDSRPAGVGRRDL